MTGLMFEVPAEQPPAAAAAVALDVLIALCFARQHDATGLFRDAHLGDGRLTHGEEKGYEAHEHQLCR